MKKELNCLLCDTKLTKNRSTNVLICKNKSCNTTYTEEQYKIIADQKRKDHLLQRELEKLIEDEKYINSDIHKTFDIDDLVNTSYSQNLKILDSYESKFYLLQSESGDLSWQRWHNLYKSDLAKCPVVFNKRSENIYKRVQFSNRILDGVLHYYYSSRLNMSPDYQRGFVWKDEHKVKLIESIFYGNDIGKMVFIRLPYQEHSYLYEILDGKQRLSTIIEFVEDRFKYKGYYYSQLQDRDKQEFLNAIIAVGETDEGFTENDKIRYFLAVNDTGVPQDQSLIAKLKKELKD